MTLLKATGILAVLLLLAAPTRSQTGSDSLIQSFYIRHYGYVIADTSIVEEQQRSGYVLVKTDLNAAPQEWVHGKNKLIFIADSLSLEPYWVKPLKRNVGRYYLTIHHKYKAPDTIDVYTGGVEVTQLKSLRRVRGQKRHYMVALVRNACKGTCGYIADGRFVYLPDEKRWAYFTFVNECNGRIDMKRID